MAAVFQTFTDELRALIAATWTDTPSDGIFELEDIMSVAWEAITPPVANMAIPLMPVDTGSWGFANEVHQGQVMLTWVGTTGGDGTNQRVKAEAMRDALLSASFTNATVLDCASIDWSNGIEINRVCLEKNYPSRAAQVAFNVLVTASVGA